MEMLYPTDRETGTNAHALHVHDELTRLRSIILGGVTAFRRSGTKPFLIAVLIAAITFLHYYTTLTAHHLHLFYQNLYFLPVILAGFWFGLRGGLITSLSITMLYLPFCIMNWEGFSPNDANALMEMVLYNVVAYILGMLRDQERMRQKRLIEAESLAAMGRAVSCLAHDMKTPLVAIGGFTRQVQKHIDDVGRASHDRCREKLEIVIKETERMEHMVKDMLDFARPLIICKDMYRVDQLVEESLAVVLELAGRMQVALERETIGEIPSIPLDAERLKQALINLVVNAVQASPPGKTVTVRLHRRKTGELSIDVIDCGCGIPPEKRMEIFQPFVTAKKEGTGLGLPIVRKIVEAHDGRLEILDNREEGTIFRITLPHP